MKGEGDFFYTKTEGASLPVLVSGNENSSTFIVFLAGGPGDSALLQHVYIPMTELEKKYRVVYYDQRNAGRSKGKLIKEKVSLEQSVKDTAHIVDLIKEKYNDPSIVLMGHSWGGALGSAYLLDEEHQKKIAGWIELDGGHNWTGMEAKSRLYAMEYAAQHQDEEKWQEASQFYKENPVINSSNIVQHALYLQASHAYAPEGTSDLDSFTISLPEMLLSYYYNVVNSNYRTYKLATIMDTFSINLTDELYRIKTPTLIVWGQKDYRISVDFAHEAYEKIGASQKSLVILPHSGHSPVTDDFDLYINSVIDFIDSLSL